MLLAVSLQGPDRDVVLRAMPRTGSGPRCDEGTRRPLAAPEVWSPLIRPPVRRTGNRSSIILHCQYPVVERMPSALSQFPGGVAQLARAPALQAGSRGFESHRLHRCCRKYNVLRGTFSLYTTSSSLALPDRGMSGRSNTALRCPGARGNARACKPPSRLLAGERSTQHHWR